MKSKSEQGFFASIRDDATKGYRFVPFVGAGLSQPSGIPIVAEFERYLTFCLFRIVGIDLECSLFEADRSGGLQRICYSRSGWDPRMEGWPGFDGVHIGPVTKQVLDGLVETIIRLLDQPAEALTGGDHRPVQASRLTIREALEASRDWRSALLFIAGLRVEVTGPGGQNHWTVERSEVDSSVIDSFFKHIQTHRQPSLGHRMIHALSLPLRISTVLTTNFDDLLEHAFALADVKLKTFEVPQGTALPPVHSVLEQSAIVKLHGGQMALRADHSLDQPPSDTDVQRFIGYLVGYPVRLKLIAGRPTLPKTGVAAELRKVAVLVVGCSGREVRSRELLRQAVVACSGVKVYWICHSEAGEKCVREIFVDELGKGRESRVTVIRHDQTGLLLLQLFQEITGSVPTAGVVFPASWNLPLPPRLPEPTGKAALREYGNIRKALREEVSRWLRPTMEKAKIVALQVDPGAHGAMHLCANLCDSNDWQGVKDPTNCLWVDLGQIAQPVGLFLRLVMSLAKAHGDEDPISGLDLSLFYSDRKSFSAALRDVIRPIATRGGKRCVVFVNAQHGLGNNSQFSDGSEILLDDGADGGKESKKNRWENGDAISDLVQTVLELAQDRGCGLVFVFLLRQPAECHLAEGLTEAEQRRRKREIALRTFFDRATKIWGSDQCTIIRMSASCVEVDPDAINRRLMTFCARPHARAFVYLLSIFRVPRYPGALGRIFFRFLTSQQPAWSRELDETRRDVVGGFLVELEKFGAIRVMDGGFVWMHARLRDDLSGKFASGSEIWQISARDALVLNSFVARWYGRLLLATADPLAANEAIYHALFGIEQHFRLIGHDQCQPELAVACAMVAHSRQILNTAAELWKKRLSDQFADRALLDTEARVRKALKAIRDAGGVLPADAAAVEALESDLRALWESIIQLRASLYLLEGEFKEVRKWGREWDQVLAKDSRVQVDLVVARATAELNLRCYPAADRSLVALLREQGIDPSAAYRPHSAAGAARSWLATRRASHPDSAAEWARLVRSAVLLVRRKADVLLHVSQAEYLATAPRSSGAVADKALCERRWHKRNQSLDLALWYAEFGLELLRSLFDTTDSFVFEQNIRLRAHTALCHGLRAASPHKPRGSSFELAEALLFDAEAYVDEFPMRDPGVVRAMLELRRAELHLLRVGTEKHLVAFRRWACGISPEKFPGGNGPVGTLEEIGATLGRLNDALRAFDRVEGVLRRHPKSRWWWWVYFALKAKACEYFFVQRLNVRWDDKREIVEAPRIIPPAVFKFMREELRRAVSEKSVTDVFQLARITDSCVKSFKAQVAHQKFCHTTRAWYTTDDLWKTTAVLGQRLREALDNFRKEKPKDRDENVATYAQAVVSEFERLKAVWLAGRVTV